MRAVRISEGERYDGDFTPMPTFTPDPPEAPCRAVLIYDGGYVEGDRVIDLGGGEHHGYVERIGEPASAADGE